MARGFLCRLNSKYTYVTTNSPQTYTASGNGKAGFIVLTNSSNANLYFWNSAGGTIYVKTLLTQIPSPVTLSKSGATVTFSSDVGIAMFAIEF